MHILFIYSASLPRGRIGTPIFRGAYPAPIYSGVPLLDTYDPARFQRHNTKNAVAKRPPGPQQGSVANRCPWRTSLGIAAGNTVVLSRGDEYHAGHTDRGDRDSMMNWGNELRVRHFRTILDQLNTMIPDTTFSVQRVR